MTTTPHSCRSRWRSGNASSLTLPIVPATGADDENLPSIEIDGRRFHATLPAR